MRCFGAVYVEERHFPVLEPKRGDATLGNAVDFPLAKLYAAPLSWNAKPSELPSQIRNASLSRLLEVQALAPGFFLRYLVGLRFRGRATNDAAKLSLGWLDSTSEEFQSSRLGKSGSERSGRKFAEWDLHSDRADDGWLIFEPRESYQLAGPAAPLDYLRLSCDGGVFRDVVLAYGVGVVVWVAGGRS